MRSRRRSRPPRQRAAASLVLLLAWVMALAPTVSHALAFARGQAPEARVEVCSAEGMRWVSLSTGQAATSAGADASATQGDGPILDAPGALHVATLAHCPFCLLSALPQLPAPEFTDGLTVPDRVTALVPAPPARCHTTRFTIQAAPRGPPTLS